MSRDLADKIVAWAAETARHAAQLPTSEARTSFLDDRRRELVAGAIAEGASDEDAAGLADACLGAAERIMIELLAARAGEPKGWA